MSAAASQITCVLIVYLAVCSGRSRKTAKLRVTGLCEGNSPVTGEFPAQRVGNAENVSSWWRHRVISGIPAERKEMLLNGGGPQIIDQSGSDIKMTYQKHNVTIDYTVGQEKEQPLPNGAKIKVQSILLWTRRSCRYRIIALKSMYSRFHYGSGERADATEWHQN